MRSLFLALTFANLLALSAALGLGFARSAGRIGELHMLIGSAAALLCVAVHCVVFTYFIATAKWIQQAVLVKRLDPALLAPTRSFKAQAFPAALLAMGSVFLAAMLGVQADLNRGRWIAAHEIAALAALALNAGMAVIEYSAIAKNGALLDRVLARIGAAPAPKAA